MPFLILKIVRLINFLSLFNVNFKNDLKTLENPLFMKEKNW
jgi:hypothetical protein